METGPKPSFQISLTWQVSTRVRGVEIQSLVQYWIKTVCCRSKDHFYWTTPLYTTGPKSGGHVPPHLMVAPPMYIRDLINTLVDSGFGCKVADQTLNIFAYTDDLVLLAPSWKALQTLISILHSQATHIDMFINIQKTKKNCCHGFCP